MDIFYTIIFIIITMHGPTINKAKEAGVKFKAKPLLVFHHWASDNTDWPLTRWWWWWWWWRQGMMTTKRCLSIDFIIPIWALFAATLLISSSIHRSANVWQVLRGRGGLCLLCRFATIIVVVKEAKWEEEEEEGGWTKGRMQGRLTRGDNNNNSNKQKRN